MSPSPRSALLLIVVLTVLVPLAHASPPDPLWTGGMFDGNDQDDAVIVAASADGAIVVEAREAIEALQVVVGEVPLPPAAAAPRSARAGVQGRAPPNA